MILQQRWSKQQAYNNNTRKEGNSGLNWVNICVVTVSDTIYQALSFNQTSKNPDSVANKTANDHF